MAAVSQLMPGLDSQPRSKNVRQVDERQMPLVVPGEKIDVPVEQIIRKRSFCAAVALCVSVTGMDDKEVYVPLGIDAGHWSRMMKGDANFPMDKLGPLMDLCGNEAPLIWLAHHRGYELRPLESETQRQLREEREAREKVEAENKVLRNLLVGRAS